jgi:hypothetical protein
MGLAPYCVMLRMICRITGLVPVDVSPKTPSKLTSPMPRPMKFDGTSCPAVEPTVALAIWVAAVTVIAMDCVVDPFALLAVRA